MIENEKLLKINTVKDRLKGDTLIAAHHYQNPEIVKCADLVGDSYKLAHLISKSSARNIILCGVNFMAESAAILAREDQKIFIPDSDALCPMAEMADIKVVEKVYEMLRSRYNIDLVPVVYVNSYIDLKNFVGREGGSTCTSSNAKIILQYYLKKNKKILFLPDYFLGANTANAIKDVNARKIIENGEIEDFDNDYVKEINIFLWDGFCPIHQQFTLNDILVLRKNYPEIKVIVHPESKEEVVNNSDYYGSTEYIYDMIKKSKKGSVWGVGTEGTFVQRLAMENPDKKVIPLKDARCFNMAKINLDKLLDTLQAISDNKAEKYQVKVENNLKINASKALNKMIEIVESSRI